MEPRRIARVPSPTSCRAASGRLRHRRRPAELLERVEERLRERRERLDRVAQDLQRHLGPHGERRLLQPLARLGTDAVRAGERLWAIGDVNGQWLLTHVGKYQGDVVAANLHGEPREANYEAVPRVTYTDPAAGAVGATEAPHSGTARVAEIAKTETYTRAYAESNGFLTLLSDGERLTGAYALGPEAGEWLQQATLAIRARVPIDVLRDTIQPFPTFSEIYIDALKALHADIAREPVGARSK